MLDYLVTSRTRRRLLELLWVDGRQETISALARQAGVAFAGAQRELQAMKAHGLAVEHGGVFAANLQHHQAEALLVLLRADPAVEARPPGTDSLRSELATLGAPLDEKPAVLNRPAEEILLDGCRMARQDASVARALPVALARRQYDLDRLIGHARTTSEKHTLGFFLELTGRLADDHKLAQAAESLRDRRRTRPQHFFPLKSEFDRKLAEQRTPDIARRWGWLMNMRLDSFESLYHRHTDAAA